MNVSQKSFAVTGRGMALATLCALSLIAAGCSSDDDPAPVASDPAVPAPADPGAPGTAGPVSPTPAPGPGAGGPVTPAPGGVSTSQFCDEGTGGTVPAQPGDPLVDAVAPAQPGAPIVLAEGISCRFVTGSLTAPGVAQTRDLAMDRANLAFLVDGEVVVSGADAFRWVDSREYCAKPLPATTADGSVFELVAKFAPDTNRPTYYREKFSESDGTFRSQLECFTGVQVEPTPAPATPAG